MFVELKEQGKRFKKHMLCNEISSNIGVSAYTIMSHHPIVRQPHLEESSTPVKPL